MSTGVGVAPVSDATLDFFFLAKGMVETLTFQKQKSEIRPLHPLPLASNLAPVPAQLLLDEPGGVIQIVSNPIPHNPSRDLNTNTWPAWSPLPPESLLATPEVFAPSENLPGGKSVSFQFCVNRSFEVDQLGGGKCASGFVLTEG